MGIIYLRPDFAAKWNVMEEKAILSLDSTQEPIYTASHESLISGRYWCSLWHSYVCVGVPPKLNGVKIKSQLKISH